MIKYIYLYHFNPIITEIYQHPGQDWDSEYNCNKNFIRN